MPSLTKLRMISFMLNYKIITFDTQDIYKNLFSFNRAMRELRDAGFVNLRKINGAKNEYWLTEKGNDLSVGLNGFEK